MNASRSDAATSTDDIKGRPLCLFYFAHPFGVLSCEPPMVVAPAEGAAPAAEGGGGAMARRTPAWPPPPPVAARRLPPYVRVLPPLRLPTPQNLAGLNDSDDVWSRSSLLPPDKVALPPIELPLPTRSPRAAGGAGGERRGRRQHRLGPAGAGVRKSYGGRSRGVLARLLRRAVATGGGDDDGSCPRTARDGRGRAALASVRAAWRATDGVGAGARSSIKSVYSGSGGSSAAAAVGAGTEAEDEATCSAAAGGPAMEPRVFSPGLLHRRYSVPETVMRRCRLAREQSEAEQESTPVSGACNYRSPMRQWVLGLTGGGRRPPRTSSSSSPCRCAGAAAAVSNARSLAGSRSEVSALPAPLRSPNSSPPASGPPFTEGSPSAPPTAPTVSDVDVLEIVVTATTPAPYPRIVAAPRSNHQRFDIDEYVSGILVDSLNSLTDRLESMTFAVGGEGEIAVVEKEIKVKLQNAGVNTVVHLSPTSNNQIIFGNEELCERDESGEQNHQTIPKDASPRTGATSPCISLVDSLDDPTSPRIPPLIPSGGVPEFVSTVVPLPQPQEQNYNINKISPIKEKSESFFIRMTDDADCACEKENVAVADRMPERIKRRLHRRHRRREMRVQGARRGATRRDLQRDVRRQCAIIVDALVDDAIARIAREEYRCARIARRRGPTLTNDTQPQSRQEDSHVAHSKCSAESVRRVKQNKMQSPIVRPPPPTLPPPQLHNRGPRRLYHKSEIHDGGKCIEILEIVEYANASRSSSETCSDESLVHQKNKKSRIPVPIFDRNDTIRFHRTSVASEHEVPLVANTRRPTGEFRVASEGARLERAFDAIPEERSSVSLESAGEDGAAPRVVPARLSAGTSPRAPAPVPPGSSPGGRGARCSAPRRRSVGTQWVRSPWRSKRAAVADAVAEPLGEDRSSSECESAEERPRPRAQPVARRRQRVYRRPHQLAYTAQTGTVSNPGVRREMAVGAGAGTSADGWSLTLAGSCRAALPARLDLRLRFPSRTACDSPVYQSGDARSQDTEWSTSDRGAASRQPAPAIRSDVSGGAGASPVESHVSQVAVRACSKPRPRPRGFSVERQSTLATTSCRRPPPPPRRAADTLPALASPPRRRCDSHGRRVRCRGRSPASRSAARHVTSPDPPAPRVRLATAPAPPAAAATSRCGMGGAGSGEAGSVPSGCSGGGQHCQGRDLAVLGSAIVPERRAAPPTASERDPVRARRARAAARRARAAAGTGTASCDCLHTPTPPPPQILLNCHPRAEWKQTDVDIRRKNTRSRYSSHRRAS